MRLCTITASPLIRMNRRGIFLVVLIGLTMVCFSTGGAPITSTFSTRTYHAFGDSITVVGSGGGGRGSYPTIIGTDKSLTVVNRAMTGIESAGMNSAEVFPNENPRPSGNPIYTILIGTNNVRNGLGAPELAYINDLESTLSWLATPSISKVPASQCSITAGGSWGTPSSGYPPGSLFYGSGHLICSIQVNNGTLYAWYLSNGLMYSLDGGSKTPAMANGATGAINLIRLTGLSNTMHTLEFDPTMGYAQTTVIGIGTPSMPNCCRVILSGVPKQMNDGQAVVTAAYDADARTACSAILGDGLNVAFMPIRNYLNYTADMADRLHPNGAGQLHIAQGFEAVW
jgi:hypothetical protein